MLGARLKRLRRSRGLSARELGQMVGVGARHIYDIESGRYSPAMATLGKVADALGVPQGWFFEQDEADPQTVKLFSLQATPFPPAVMEFLTRSVAGRWLSLCERLSREGVQPDEVEALVEAARRMSRGRKRSRDREPASRQEST